MAGLAARVLTTASGAPCFTTYPPGRGHIGMGNSLCCSPQMACNNSCCETDPADFADMCCANESASLCCPSGDVAVQFFFLGGGGGGVEGDLMCCPMATVGHVGGAL